MLIDILKSNIGKTLTSEIAADIMVAANQLSTLVHRETIARVKPADYQEFTFAIELIDDITDEIKPLHLAHWNETEAHRHGLPFNPDYQTFFRYERAGRYILFTLRKDGILLGNCAMYLDKSTHTQTLIATEDTLYLCPEARKGRTAMRFVRYVEEALLQLGVREIEISVKITNRAGKFFEFMGYRQVEIGLKKVIKETE